MGSATLKMTDAEFAMRQIKSDMEITPQIYKYVCDLAKEWGVSPLTIAWIGNKPYPMQGALYAMLKDKCKDEGLVVQSIIIKPLQRVQGSVFRAGSDAEIVLFDLKTFKEVLSKTSLDKVPIENIARLKEMLTHTYKEEGWASPESVRMSTLHNADYINHMANTRAVDRCLRIIVRMPFTAASELPDGEPAMPEGARVEGDAPAGAGGPPLIRPAGKTEGQPVAKPGGGKAEGQPVSGAGYVEMTGYGPKG